MIWGSTFLSAYNGHLDVNNFPLMRDKVTFTRDFLVINNNGSVARFYRTKLNLKRKKKRKEKSFYYPAGDFLIICFV